jgi:diaminohydroxyphosphoribosylaminopyrimidine deaminase/5-amino-6-(5-phosphoribosylamino)uracil reductase
VVDIDRNFMRKALLEAKKGVGRTSPNPSVGAIVIKNGLVVGKGYHRRAGTPHAEIHALRQAGSKAQGGTLYVTLEPCNHTGRTPPCTEAVLKAGIARVVIGMHDPNPEVAGGGAGYLASQGINVITGILEEDCREINLPFIKHVTTGLPWVTLKAGMSIDGRIAAHPGQPSRITGNESLRRVHVLRNQADAILVGIGTVLADDPSLTARLDRIQGRDPLRVVLDKELRMPQSSKMLRQKSAASTWIFCSRMADKQKRKNLEESGAIIKSVPVAEEGLLDLKAVLTELGKARITSVLVEGGSCVHGSFLQANLVDQLLLFISPVVLGDQGVPLATFPGRNKSEHYLPFKITNTRRYGDDVLIEGRFSR